MLRILYTILLRLHPQPFQARFGAEMQLTFEEARNTEGAARLVLDAVLSLFRQHFLRAPANDRLPVLAGVIRLSQPPPRGVSPYRLFQGGLVSLALFFMVCFWLQGGKTGRGGLLLRPDATTAQQGQPLTPSDLATIHVECAQQARPGCSSATQGTVAPSDETMEWQVPLTQKREADELLLPSGPFRIGRVLYKWPEQRNLGTSRPPAQERFVFVWYPAAPKQSTTRRFTSVWNYSRANQLLVETHTLEEPPIAPGMNRFPVLLFYPSMNSSSAAYTTQIENLVSHGYVVASLEPSMDWSVVSFSNTQLLPLAADLRRAYRGSRQPSRDAFLKRALEIQSIRQKSLADDLSFVLDKLTVLNQASEKAAPFKGRLDLSSVGAVGHSDGGTAAGLACQLDRRIQACASENGWTPQGPHPNVASGPIPSRPFLWINLPLSPPENEQLAYLHMGRSEFDRWARTSETLAEQELNALPNGAYRVTVRLPDVTDRYFTDGPFVWSLRDRERGVTERNVLVIVNTYVRAFFDYHLGKRRGAPSQLLDGSVRPLPLIEVQRYSSPLS